MDVEPTSPAGHPSRQPRGFTLVELMVAMAVFTVIALMLLTVINNVSQLVRRSREQTEGFQGARIGFESLTRALSQATLNTYWDYYDSAGKPASDPAYNGVPYKYGRQSELHLVSGQAQSLIASGSTGTLPTHAVFFQAPLGQAADSSLKPLNNTLNACGFFVEFGSDKEFRPDFLANQPGIKERFRYRLMQMYQPTENLQIYSTGTGNGWFTGPLAAGASRPVQVVAENIIALVLIPKLSANGSELAAPDYSYDSRAARTFGTGTSKGNTLHQLPPLIEVIMVGLDESSAQRLAAVSNAPPDLGLANLFKNIDASKTLDDKTGQLETDLTALGAKLTSLHLSFRIFRTDVSIRGAKWSSD